jgi:two-component system nitrate/nitrite response regulator NarL
MLSPINIMLAVDHTLFAAGIRSILQQTPGIQLPGIAFNGAELMEMLEYHQPDIIILDIDINMPFLRGLEAARQIREAFPQIRLIILSSSNAPQQISQAHQYGANGYLLKTCNKEELLQTIELVHKGQHCFPSMIPLTDKTRLKQFNLTRRETEILQLLNQQYTNQQIAVHLHLSIYTVETHRKNIMQKLQLKTPMALTRFMLEKGL